MTKRARWITIGIGLAVFWIAIYYGGAILGAYDHQFLDVALARLIC